MGPLNDCRFQPNSNHFKTGNLRDEPGGISLEDCVFGVDLVVEHPKVHEAMMLA